MGSSSVPMKTAAKSKQSDEMRQDIDRFGVDQLKYRTATFLFGARPHPRRKTAYLSGAFISRPQRAQQCPSEKSREVIWVLGSSPLGGTQMKGGKARGLHIQLAAAMPLLPPSPNDTS